MYCPVPGCPLSDSQRAAGWESMGSLRRHLAEHIAGRLDGDVPQEFLDAHRLNICTVCSRLLSSRFGSVCPRCRPEMQRAHTQGAPQAGRPMPDGYPSLEEVFRTAIVCKSYVPKAAKNLWAQCLLSAISMVLRHNDELAWTELLMLPKSVLRSSPRGGKKHQSRIDAETKRLCKDWLDGHRVQLWRQSKVLHERRGPARRQPVQQQSQRKEKAIRLMKEELLSKACGALVNPSVAQVTPGIRREMVEKHPGARSDDLQRMQGLRQVHAAAAPGADAEMTRKAVRAFPRGSSAGPTGLRPQHLKDAMVPSLEDEILRHYAQLVGLLARGHAPPALGPWLCGAALAALEKPQGGHRPVAVGETWRRLTAKILASSVNDDLRDHLEPLQLGVGTKLACEAIVHVVRQWCARWADDTSRCLVKMDLSNAFNCVDRSAVLAAVRRVVPELAPWADFCYKHPSRLILGGSLLHSERGVQQGDPLGPAFFALAIQSAVANVKSAVESNHPQELDFTVFYLDDGVVAGTGRAVSQFCTLLRAELANIGLDLALDKCEIVPSAKDHHAIPAHLFPGYLWVPTGDFKLLGAPLGSLDFCTAHTQKRARKAGDLMHNIASLGHAQGSYLLLKQCAGFAKLAYSMRTVPPEFHESALSAFGDDLRSTLAAITGELFMEDRCWELAQLNIKIGGVGVRTPARHAAAAYLASVMASRDLCRTIDSAYDADDRHNGLRLTSSTNRFHAGMLEAARVSLDDGNCSQSRLSALVEAADKHRLLNSPDADASFEAHTSLSSLPTAGVWLTALPSDDSREMSHRLFQIALKRRLRMRIFAADGFCLSCGGCMDRFGDHASVCSCNGDRTVRHNCCRNLVCHEASLAGLGPEKEKAGLLPGRPESDGLPNMLDPQRRRPADVWLPSGSSNGSQALDFACTSGMRADMLNRVILQAPAVFAEYEQYKKSYKDTERLCRDRGFAFCPMIAEAHSGAWSPAARKMFDFMTQRAAEALSVTPEVESLRFAQRLSIALQRENARAIARRMAETSETEECSEWHAWIE